MARYLAFDLETTGTDPSSDRIVEFCFIELDDDLAEKARWTELVHPQVKIPVEVTRIHGITDDMVATKAPFARHAPRIQKLVEGTVLVGHNVRFDVQFLHHELQRAQQPGLAVDHPTVDTSYLEAIIHPRNLGALYAKYTGRDLDDAHRSEADTAATVEVLRAQLREHGGKRLPSTLAELETRALRQSRDPGEFREWLDHGRRFYRNDRGIVCFGFGKHRDRPAGEEKDYLRWMLRQSFPPEVQRIIRAVLESGGDVQLEQRTPLAASIPDSGPPPDGGHDRPGSGERPPAAVHPQGARIVRQTGLDERLGGDDG